MDRRVDRRWWWCGALWAVGGLACSAREAPVEPPEDDTIPQVPVPAADGPQLLVLEHRAIVRERPSLAGKPLGTLRAGATVARAAEPYGKRGCEGGWYPIRPRGFVCAGSDATVDLETPTHKALATAPALGAPLPYRYGRVRRGDAVVYRALPNREEQRAAEPKLGSRKPTEPEVLGTGSNDVPLAESGLPSGPPVLLPDAEGVAADGRRTSDSFFAFAEQVALQPGTALVPSDVPGNPTEVLRRASGLALAAGVTVGEGEAARRFGVMPDGRFVPLDRLEPALGTSWHGLDLAAIGLPVAFTLRDGVRPWSVEGSEPKPIDDELEPRQGVALTGRFRTVQRVKFFATTDDRWLRAKDIIYVPKRDKFPDWASPEQKWIDVSLANQTLVAWHGHKPLFATLLSSGKDRLGDPQTGPATAQGVFRLRSKAISQNIDDRENDGAFSVWEAPWYAEFEEGFALEGSYWLGRFGEAQGFHDLALAPVDAHWLWQWMDPEIPEGWHSLFIADGGSPNTVVYVHK